MNCWLRLSLFLRESLKDAMKLVGTGLEAGNNILGGGLEKSDDIGDELVLALDSFECAELVGTYVNCLLYISGLEGGELSVLVTLYELLDELCGRIAHIAEHQRS